MLNTSSNPASQNGWHGLRLCLGSLDKTLHPLSLIPLFQHTSKVFLRQRSFSIIAHQHRDVLWSKIFEPSWVGSAISRSGKLSSKKAHFFSFFPVGSKKISSGWVKNIRIRAGSLYSIYCGLDVSSGHTDLYTSRWQSSKNSKVILKTEIDVKKLQIIK